MAPKLYDALSRGDCEYLSESPQRALAEVEDNIQTLQSEYKKYKELMSARPLTYRIEVMLNTESLWEVLGFWQVLLCMSPDVPLPRLRKKT